MAHTYMNTHARSAKHRYDLFLGAFTSHSVLSVTQAIRVSFRYQQNFCVQLGPSNWHPCADRSVSAAAEAGSTFMQ